MTQNTNKVSVTVAVKKSTLDYIKTKIKRIRFDRPFVLLWVYKMWLGSAYFAKGASALLTLTILDPDITAKPSMFLAAQLMTCRKIREQEDKALLAAKRGEEYVPAKVEMTYEEECEAFCKLFEKEGA